MTEVTKRTGWDWVITYQFEDDPVESMLVFGSMTIEDAIKEARFSLGSNALTGEDQDDYTILGVTRFDHIDKNST